MKQIKKRSQIEIDQQAVREMKAVGADNRGGQDKITPGQNIRPSVMGPLKNYHSDVREG